LARQTIFNGGRLVGVLGILYAFGEFATRRIEKRSD